MGRTRTGIGRTRPRIERTRTRIGLTRTSKLLSGKFVLAACLSKLCCCEINCVRLSGLTVVDKVQWLRNPLDYETEYFSGPSPYKDVALSDFSFNSPLLQFLSRALDGLLRENRGSVNRLFRPWRSKSRPAALQQSRNTTTSCKSTLDTVPYFGINGLSMILCL